MGLDPVCLCREIKAIVQSSEKRERHAQRDREREKEGQVGYEMF